MDYKTIQLLDFLSTIQLPDYLWPFSYRTCPITECLLYHQYCQSGDFQIKPVNHPNPTDIEAARWWTPNVSHYRNETRKTIQRRMNTTVSGTDDLGQRHISQITASSTTQPDGCPGTTSNQRIIYTTAQLHENINILSKNGKFRNVQTHIKQNFDRPNSTWEGIFHKDV